MLSLDTAQKLKTAGLEWTPVQYDFFAIPYQGLDESLYAISDMSVLVEKMGNDQAITFNGSVEWALDYLIITEAIWVPREEQLRDLIEKRLVEHGEEQPVLTLTTTSDGYRCEIRMKGAPHSFDAFVAGEAYAAALLYIMKTYGESG